MQESVIYQDILQQTEALTLVMRLLVRQLGTVEPRLQAQVQKLSQVQLENLAEALLDFSEMANLVGWLEQEEPRAN